MERRGPRAGRVQTGWCYATLAERACVSERRLTKGSNLRVVSLAALPPCKRGRTLSQGPGTMGEARVRGNALLPEGAPAGLGPSLLCSPARCNSDVRRMLLLRLPSPWRVPQQLPPPLNWRPSQPWRLVSGSWRGGCLPRLVTLQVGGASTGDALPSRSASGSRRCSKGRGHREGSKGSM